MPTTTKIPAAIPRKAEGGKATAAPDQSQLSRRAATSLRINEIFLSLQGESTRVGLPTVFVRLTGCPLRCGYCDTAYAFHEGTTRPLDEVVAEVASHGVPTVCVTGGEPLAQRACLDLLTALCDAGHSVSLETSGAIDVSPVDARVSRILDIKTPGSGEVDKNRWDNLACLDARDEIKFVICDRADFDWATRVVKDRRLERICTVLFSPAFGAVAAADLAAWILDHRVPIRMQLQLHKILWGERRGV